VIGERGTRRAEGPPDLPAQVGCAKVQVQPVLLLLVIGGALHGHLDALAVFQINLRFGVLTAGP
jgi:hypothetical protein